MLPVVFGFAGTGSFPGGPFSCVFTGAVCGFAGRLSERDDLPTTTVAARAAQHHRPAAYL
jgi:hypothetical protein